MSLIHQPDSFAPFRLELADLACCVPHCATDVFRLATSSF